MSSIALIAAMAENRVIGKGNAMLWHIPEDFKHFKKLTTGKPIIMGRKTYEGIGRPLPGRVNIVVTRDKAWRAEGVETAHSLSEAITLAKVRGRCMAGIDEICVVGGGEIYAQALPLADRLHVTHVLASVEGDAHFPPIDPDLWRVARAEDVPAGEKDSHATRYTVYERRRGAN